ncbi:hypothetical protein E2C01_020495 [Portunus trituberculatus]|uniref:Uncharacterized protein n=1 Tax=Portunus trituberculatus TaxID=210409 RepID=A0A5B7E1V2_PORTR|nr:hypothetical protein [Portunus trituberculatus]
MGLSCVDDGQDGCRINVLAFGEDTQGERVITILGTPAATLVRDTCRKTPGKILMTHLYHYVFRRTTTRVSDASQHSLDFLLENCEGNEQIKSGFVHSLPNNAVLLLFFRVVVNG